MKAFLTRALARFEATEQELNALDAATGDGDHGSTMVKGLRAAMDAPDNPAKAFRKAAGGASGSLFAEVIGALEKTEGGVAIGPSLKSAADRIAMLGQAKSGEKTLLDALIPASDADTAAAAASAAEDGRLATKDMAAKRGRAKHVEGAGVGHVDAGATSVAVLLAVFAEQDGGR